MLIIPLFTVDINWTDDTGMPDSSLQHSWGSVTKQYSKVQKSRAK